MARIEGVEMVARDGGEGAGEVFRTRPVGRRREDRIVGASRGTEDLIEQATAAARSDLPVLIVGVPGSDKELVARAIHAWGPRQARRFTHQPCVSIPEALQAREIFGCAKGTYPAVPDAYVGALESTGAGTLYLDHVESLTAGVRDALRRTVSERSWSSEGAGAPRPLEARIIMSADSSMGESLFGDTPHHEIRIAPLASRPEDVLPLAAHLLASFSEEAGIKPVGFTADARACLLSESWPGDARELRERIRQAVRLAGSGAISAEALMLARDAEDVPSFKEAKRAFETRYVTGLLRRCSGNISRAARLAKKDRKDFYDVIRRTGIDPQRFR